MFERKQFLFPGDFNENVYGCPVGHYKATWHHRYLQRYFRLRKYFFDYLENICKVCNNVCKDIGGNIFCVTAQVFAKISAFYYFYIYFFLPPHKYLRLFAKTFEHRKCLQWYIVVIYANICIFMLRYHKYWQRNVQRYFAILIEKQHIFELCKYLQRYTCDVENNYMQRFVTLKYL